MSRHVILRLFTVATLVFSANVGHSLADPPSCVGTGDMNADGNVDGDDIQSFVECLIGSGAGECAVADFTLDGQVTPADVPEFTDRLMSGVPSLTLPGAAWFMTMPPAESGDAPPTRVDFSAFPIPAGFFGPDSDPFSGVVWLNGQPLNAAFQGTTDTVIAHGTPVFDVALPSAAPAVCLQIRDLNLVGHAPITITYNGGETSQEWNVSMQLSAGMAGAGTLTATQYHANGGTADIVAPLLPAFSFVRLDDPLDQRRLDFHAAQLPPIVLTANGVPWVARVAAHLGVLAPPVSAFVLGVEEDPQTGHQSVRTSQLSAAGANPAMIHAVQPAYDPNPVGYLSVTEISSTGVCPSEMPRDYEVSATWSAARCGVASIRLVHLETDAVLAYLDGGCAASATLTTIVALKPTDIVQAVVETCGPHADRDCCIPATDDITCSAIAGPTYLSLGSDGQGEAGTLTCRGAPESSLWTRTRTGNGNVSPLDFNGAGYPLTASSASSAAQDIIIDRASYDNDGDRSLSQGRLTVASFKLTRLSFGGESNRAIAKDQDGQPYSAPHWRDDNGDGDASDLGEPRFPVCYIRDGYVTVADVAFSSQPAGLPPCGLEIRGTASDGNTYEAFAEFVGDEWVVQGEFRASARLPNSIQCMNSYSIQWQARYSDAAYGAAGASDNPMYVILGEPLVATLHETVAYLACHNAIGVDTEDAAVAGIWQDFRDRNVRRKPIDGFNRVDGIQMGFWRSRSSVSYLLSTLLANPYGDGACGAWAELLNACFRAHGIGNNQFVEILPNRTLYPEADGILVRDWSFQHNMNTGMNGINNSIALGDDVVVIPLGRGMPYGYAIFAGPDNVLDSIAGGDDVAVEGEINCGPNGICESLPSGDDVSYTALGDGQRFTAGIIAGPNGILDTLPMADDLPAAIDPLNQQFPYIVGFSAVNLMGSPGQDNPEPPAAFSNHLVARHAGKIYDPSYGLGPFDTQLEHENAIMSGIRSGDFVRPINPNLQELVYTDQ